MVSRRFRSVKPVVYAVHAQCMQLHALSMQLHAAVAIRCLGLRAIIHGARWYMGVVSFSVSGCTPPPLPPGVPEKRGGSQATAHALRHTAF